MYTHEESKTQVKINFTDTAGQEWFHSLADQNFKNCNGVILVYDVTNRKSFDNISYWFDKIVNNSS